MKDSDLAERNLSLADRTHNLLDEQKIHLFRASLELGSAALRTSILITGGSVVVGLAFVGSMYSSQQTDIAVELFRAVFIFAIGALTAGLASGAAYIGQNKRNEAAHQIEKTDEAPFIVFPQNFVTMERKAGRWIVLAVTFVGISYLCIFIGLLFAWDAIKFKTILETSGT